MRKVPFAVAAQQALGGGVVAIMSIATERRRPGDKAALIVYHI